MIIYLDQNKWIDLARAYHNKDESRKYTEIMNKIVSCSENEKHIFPLSIVHLLETYSAQKFDRRIRLAEVMTKISNNYSIIPYFYIERDEFKNGIKILNGYETDNLKEKVISKDFLVSTGLSKNMINVESEDQEVREYVENFLKSSPDILFQLFALGRDPDDISEEKEEDEEIATELEKDREMLLKVPEEYQLKLLMWRYFEFRFLPMVKGVLLELGISSQEFAELTQNGKIIKLMEEIPSLNVRSKLTYARIRDTSKKIHRNDTKDLAFLSVAIPYCDVVVTENSWVHYAKNVKLDSKYNTILYSDLNQLNV